MIRRVVAALALPVLLVVAPFQAARAFDPEQTFRRGALVLSAEGAYGEQDNLEGHRHTTGLDLFNLGVRFSLLPFGTSGPGPLYGALEVGLEPFYQRYVDSVDAYWAGLGLVVRYHFLALGRFVPYLEFFGAAGGTDLEVREIRSSFAFLVQGGIGASYFVTDTVAVYAGYRLQHVSNGNTSRPNRGFEADTGLLGVSIVFP